MATQIGRFELLSEIAKSDRGCIYKANDSTNGQTVALKTVRLAMPEDQARALSERVQAEADTINALSSPNIAQLYGVGEFENILCAAMEYVQGNSVATMLARKEGFSIWDLLDISRQVCLGLDHAHSRSVVHYSFEPAKVMVQWDGTVKLLSFGISTMGMLPRELSGKAPMILHYASPEQLRGEPIDPRSNFFSWAAILYEMVTDHKAFDGEDATTVQQKILEGNPIPPAELNSKIHPKVSDLILKALSATPDQRFQNGQQLIAELELCKQASTQAAARKASASPQGLIPPSKVSPGTSAKTTSPTASPAPAQRTSVPSAKTSAPPAEKKAAVQPQPELESVLESSAPANAGASAPPAAKRVAPSPPPLKKAAAAAASSGASGAPVSSRRAPLDPSSPAKSTPPSTGAEGSAKKSAQLSAAPPVEAETAAKFAVDPMMAEGSSAGHAASFSDLEEMPPLKEAFVAPKTEAEASEPEPPIPVPPRKSQPAKAKVQARVVAKEAIKEIKSVPPQLMMYSIAAAVAIALAIGVGLVFHWRSQNAEDEGSPPPAVATQAKPVIAQSTSSPATPDATPAQSATPAPAEASTPVEVAPVVKPRYKHKNSSRAPAQPSIVPGQVALDSTPQGAQVQVDGRTDSGWVTPLTVTQLTPGRHTIILSKPGYVSETATLNIASGAKSSAVLHLAVAGATVSVRSDPAGASVFVDGKDSGRVTPAQISVEKGSHTLLVRKQGFLDETTSANLQSGQNFHFAPSLRPLGNADDIKTVGKFKKIFGAGDTAGMGTVNIKTQPKGAQIAVNRRMLDKASPVQFMVGPGNYIIDITASGYKTIHTVITVEKGGKTVLDEVMDRE